MENVEKLLKDLINEVRATREYLIESEARTIIIQRAESLVDKGLDRHIRHVEGRLNFLYSEGKKTGNQKLIDALDHSPVKLFSVEYKK